MNKMDLIGYHLGMYRRTERMEHTNIRITGFTALIFTAVTLINLISFVQTGKGPFAFSTIIGTAIVVTGMILCYRAKKRLAVIEKHLDIIERHLAEDHHG
jgi:hypothetical protein